MTGFEKLGKKCTSVKCHKECPIYYFNHEGAGVNAHNGCMEALRFPTVAAAVKLWISDKEYDRQSLHKFGGDYD